MAGSNLLRYPANCLTKNVTEALAFPLQETSIASVTFIMKQPNPTHFREQ